MRTSTCCSARAWSRNLGGFMSGVNNNGAHSANGITALFIATGQDVANVAESSAAFNFSEILPNGDYYVSITIPSLIVATYGGGTGLATQQECLELLGLPRRGQGAQVRGDRRGDGPVRRAVAGLGDRRRGVGEGTRPVREEPMNATEDRTAELRALGRLAAEELRGGVGGIGGLHRGIAERVFWGVEKGVGPAAAPVRVAHDAISGGVYAAARGAAGVLGLGATEAAVRLREDPAGPAPSTTRRGSLAIGILTGLRGDTLEREENPLAQPMAVRVDGHPIAPRREELARAFPSATPRLVVFLHGLMETEFSWRLGDREAYGARLERDLGCTAVDVRFNSGRRISQNGRSLADLLELLVAEWPVDVDEIALVGHSMGGLVARSACHQAAEEDAPWAGRVRHVVSLGSPHFGAPLEELVHVAAVGLGKLPETRPVSNFLRRRSGGIRDLRRGSLVDEDWRDRDPEALRASACQEVPLLPGATHCFISATVTRSPKHPIGRVFGDLLVLTDSASGRSRTRELGFKDEHGAHVGGVNHFALLNHPVVYEKLREWLATPPEAISE